MFPGMKHQLFNSYQHIQTCLYEYALGTQCLAGKDRFLDQQIHRYLQIRTNMAVKKIRKISLFFE